MINRLFDEAAASIIAQLFLISCVPGRAIGSGSANLPSEISLLFHLKLLP